MGKHSTAAHVIRFGVFEVDLRAGELRKNGLKIRLQEQPFAVLAMLLERPGDVVTREELQKKLWSGDTFVDFDTGINTSIKKIREALGDSADNPRFVETLPRRGYRFIVPVKGVGPAVFRLRTLRQRIAVGALALVALAVVLVGLNVAGLRERLGGGLAPGEIQSLAVLPLENLSGDPEQEYFVDGMTDALTSELSKIDALRVISRASAEQINKRIEAGESLPKISRELNLDAVVEGSVLPSGDRVRIMAQLIGTKPERHLWAETFDRDLGDVLALHSEVAHAIVREINITLTPQDETRLAGTRPVNPEALEAFLKGQYFMKKGDVQRAFEFAQQAIEIDPGYAPAYALLAYTYYEGGWQGAIPVSEARAKAMAAAMKALEIDDTLAEAHTWLGTVLYIHDWEWAAAEREFKRAIELNPNLAIAHGEYAFYLIVIGRSDEALREAQRAQELDPLTGGTYFIVQNIYMFERQYDLAIENSRKQLEVNPDRPTPYVFLAGAYEAKGMYDESVAAWQKFMTLTGVSPEDVAAYGHAFEVGGIRGSWRWSLEWLKEKPYNGNGNPKYIAGLHVALGENDQALEWLETAYEDRPEGMVWLKPDPIFDPLRSDPRFQDLLRRMNLPE